jgi:dolichol kinase
MNASLAVQSRPIALELHGLLRDIDPSRFRQDLEQAIRRRIATLAEAIRGVIGERQPQLLAGDGVAAALADLATLLGERVPEPELQADDSSLAWSNFRKQLGQAYEALSLRLRAESVRLPSLRPTNYTRSIVHALTGASCIVLVEYLLSKRARAIVPTVFALSFWFLETLRRVSETANRFLMWIFRHIAHPREAHHVNSSTWMGTALALLGVLFPRSMCAMAIAVIAFADPAASLMGRRYGRVKLVGDRSLVGTVTFAVVATLVGFATLFIWHSEIATARALTIAAIAGVAAALTELFSKHVDDNFSVPMVAGSVGWLVLSLG